MWVGGEGKGEKAGVGSRFLQMEYGWGVGGGTHTRDGEMEWVADSAEGGDPARPTLPAVSTQGRADARKQLTLGRLPALAWSDQSPVTGAQCLPFPSLRLSWKPRLAGSRERWVPGPLPSPSPPSPCQAWHLPRPGLSQDKEELSRAVLPGLDLLPGKMKIAPRGVGGAGWNFFGLCSGWGFLEGQMWSTGVHTEVLPQIQIASLEGPSGSWGYPGSP